MEKTLQTDPQNETALLWMSQVVDTDEDRIFNLKRVLEVNPNNNPAKRGLVHLQPDPPKPVAPAKKPPPTPAPQKLNHPSQPAKLWDAETGEELMSFVGHSDGVENVAFNSASRNFASASSDNTAKLWNIDTGEEIRTFTGHTDDLNSLVFNPAGTRLATASDDQTIKIWDAETGQELATFQGHTSAIQDVSFSKDGRYLATASQDRTVHLFLLNRDDLIKQAYIRLSSWWEAEDCLEYLGSEECPPPPAP